MKRETKIIIAIIFCILIYILGKVYEIPDDNYIKMQEINDNKSLIGLSKEEVAELLGEPRYQYIDVEDKQSYIYNAGTTVKKRILGNSYGRKVYDFRINFDENGKVEHTYIKECT